MRCLWRHKRWMNESRKIHRPMWMMHVYRLLQCDCKSGGYTNVYHEILLYNVLISWPLLHSTCTFSAAINWSRLVTLQWSGLWDVTSLQTLCWEIRDKSRSWVTLVKNGDFFTPLLHNNPLGKRLRLFSRCFLRNGARSLAYIPGGGNRFYKKSSILTSMSQTDGQTDGRKSDLNSAQFTT